MKIALLVSVVMSNIEADSIGPLAVRRFGALTPRVDGVAAQTVIEEGAVFVRLVALFPRTVDAVPTLAEIPMTTRAFPSRKAFVAAADRARTIGSESLAQGVVDGHR